MAPTTTAPARKSTPTPRRPVPARPNARTAPPRRRRWVAGLRRVFFIFLLLAVATAGGLGYLFASIPLPEDTPPLSQTSFLCASDVTTGCEAENSMAQFTGGVDRVTVSYDQLPPVLIHAVIAAEDREFFDHQGVDPVGVGRALLADIRSEGVQQGGSTITQQYVKNTYLTNDRTMERKVKEAVIAVKLEKEVPKQEILLRYLNTIYFGRGAYGVGAAARVYFGKKVEDLNAADAAYLAGLIRAPELADGNRDPAEPDAAAQRTEADRRRQTVLDAMVEEGYLTTSEAETAGQQPFTCDVDQGEPCFLRPRRQSTNFGDVKWPQLGGEHYIEYVRKFLTTEAGFTDAEIFGGGLRIYTAFDPVMQERALDSIQSTLGREGDPQASLVSVDTEGRIRALVGCWDPQNCQDPAQYQKQAVNLATGKLGGGSGRQPGSTFKPVALAEALKQGVPLNEIVDAPGTKVFAGANDGGDWTVSSYAGENSSGKLTLYDATRLSSNTAYAQLILDVGVANVAELSQRMGVTSTAVPEVPSIVLGTAQVSTLDMASVYSTFMNKGEHIAPTPVLRVTDAQGNVLWEPTYERDRVLPPEVAEQVTFALNGVVRNGTGKGAWFGEPVAGKTGTTQNNVDAWFAGYHCTMTTVVWMGYAEGEATPMKSVHGRQVLGGSFPATIWKKFMADSIDPNVDCPYNERPASAPKSLGGSSSSTKTTTGSGKKTTTTTAKKKTTTTAAPTTKAPVTTTPTTKAPATTATTTATTDG